MATWSLRRPPGPNLCPGRQGMRRQQSDAARHGGRARSDLPDGVAFEAPGYTGTVGAIDWSAIPAEEALPGIWRQTAQAERSTTIRYVYSPGSVFPEHHHPEEQTTIVLSGRILFTLSGAELEVGPGSTLVIPSDAPHGARVTGGETVETINVLAPRRAVSPGRAMS